MKTFALMAALLVSTSSFAAGWTTQSFGKYFYAPTEEEVLAQVEAAIPTIAAGQDKELSRSMEFQDCRPIHPRHIKIGKTFVKKFWRNDNGTLVVKYRAILTVSHNHCFESHK